jgi:Ca2+-binding EF-hand superfamily protein
MKKIIPLIVFAFASTGLLADEDLMAKLDTDKDGQISIEEAAEDSVVSAMFTQLDENKDGFLSTEELDKLENVN